MIVSLILNRLIETIAYLDICKFYLLDTDHFPDRKCYKQPIAGIIQALNTYIGKRKNSGRDSRASIECSTQTLSQAPLLSIAMALSFYFTFLLGNLCDIRVYLICTSFDRL